MRNRYKYIIFIPKNQIIFNPTAIPNTGNGYPMTHTANSFTYKLIVFRLWK